MSIKFFCRCGKHLRAREALAGKRSVCPACGELVGVPMLQPTQRGTTVAPLTVAERSKIPSISTFPIPAPDSLAAAAQHVFDNDIPGPPPPDGAGRAKRTPRRALALEKHWYQCLLFPVHAFPMVLLLSLALAALSAVGVMALPDLGGATPPPAWVWLIVWVAPFLVLGYLCGFLQCVLASAAAGETGFVRWPGIDLPLIARALLAWIVCFLSGPVVFAAAAFWFWLYAGVPTLLDWLIVIELGVVGACHWLLALVAVHQGDRLRDANPVRVGDVIRRLGYGAVVAILIVSALGLVFGWLIVSALEWIHEDAFPGLLLLTLGWCAGLAWLTFFFRLLGVWCFRSRVELQPGALQAAP